MECEGPNCDAVLADDRVARGARYCTGECRAAAWRARNGYLPLSAGGPRPVAREGRSNGSRSKPSGKQVAYFKAVDAVTAELEQLRRFGFAQMDDAGESERDWARRVLGEALPERQRERLRS